MEVLEPGWNQPESRARLPGLYVGPPACLEPKHLEVLKTFEVGVVFQLLEESEEASQTRGMKLHSIEVPKMEISESPQLVAKVATLATELCERIVSQKLPCFVCGPWSALVVALCVKKLLGRSSSLRRFAEVLRLSVSKPNLCG